MNRVFDSSGPEGKVRGTPQQIIEKYNQLARDAQLANDRVAAENFQQHAEHYLRMLSEAQREMEARREQQERDHRGGYRQQGDQGSEEQRDERQPEPRSEVSFDGPSGFGLDDDQPEVDTGLVETPETAPKKPRRPRRPRGEKAEGGETSSDTPEAAE